MRSPPPLLVTPPIAPLAARAVALAFLAAGAGCLPGNRSDEFPLSVGFDPLEPATDAPLPARGLDGSYPEAVTEPPTSGNRDGHYWAHGRGYVHAPLDRVYAALHDPGAGRLHNGGGASVTLAVEPSFPITYAFHYTNSAVGGLVHVWYDVVYRGGVLEGADDAPQAVGLRYQKTDGTEEIDVLTGSTVARPTDDPEVTEVEMVSWLSARTQDASDARQTVRDQFENLTAVLATLP